MSVVSLVHTTDPSEADIARLLDLAGAGDCIPSGAQVFVKPNYHGAHGYTSPRVVGAICRYAFSRGASRVYAGDGPFWGMEVQDTARYFAEAGLTESVESAGATVVNLHERDYRPIRTGDPDLPEEIGLAELFMDSDIVINAPLLKTHFNTLMTLGIKNIKGCLRRKDKKRFHEMELNAALVGLANFAAPRIAVTILDATTAVEGMGPAAGTDVDMGIMAASTDLVAVDAVGCALAGIEPTDVRFIREAAARGVGVADLDEVTIAGESLDAHRRTLKLPHDEIRASFPNLTIAAASACSGCAMNLFEALAAILAAGEEVRVPAVAIGTGARIEAGLAVGACAKNSGGHPLVKGCPPKTHEIRAALRQP